MQNFRAFEPPSPSPLSAKSPNLPYWSSILFSLLGIPPSTLCVDVPNGSPLMSLRFQGMEVHGIADYVISGGRVVVDDGDLRVVQGMGRFVPNPPHSPYVYERIKQAEEVSSKIVYRLRDSADGGGYETMSPSLLHLII